MPPERESGRLYLVATPIGNLEDLTHRATRVLGDVDIIAAEDTRRTMTLLRHYDIEPPELVSLFEGNEARRSDELLARLEAGATVAVVTDAGTPSISDPGQRLAALAAKRGLPIEALPGPSAALVALVASGLPSAEFRFTGFLPRGESQQREALGRLRNERATMIFFEAPGRVGTTLTNMALAFGDEREAAVARELTKLHEELVRGTIAELAATYRDKAPRGECTLVVAGAAEGQDGDIDVEAELSALLASGLGPKQAAQRLVVKTGLPRRHLYQLALSLSPRPSDP